MKKKTFLLAAVAILLVAAIAAGGTYAWLTSRTDPVVNTFTVGNVSITLDEARVQKDETTSTWSATAARVKQNDYEGVYPGAKLPKDPTVHVSSGSEDAVVYVMIQDALNAAVPGSADYTVGSAWTAVETTGYTAPSGAAARVYRCNATAHAGDDLVVFNGVTIAETVTAAQMPLLDGTITVTAFAVQANGLNTATADAQALAAFGFTK